VKQQKCLAHQRTLSEVLALKKGCARDVAERTRELLRLAVQLWEEYHWGSRAEFDRWVPEVRFALSYHLRDRPLKDQDNRKLLRMLRRYHQRGDLLCFLEQPDVEPTNNRVERMPRPAVSDCPQGLPVFQNLVRGPCLRHLYQCNPNDLEEGCPVLRGRSTGRPFPRPTKPDYYLLTDRNPAANQVPKMLALTAFTTSRGFIIFSRTSPEIVKSCGPLSYVDCLN
jgi:hypothetical protein